MFFATTNQTRNLLHLSFIGRVRAAELSGRGGELRALLADLSTGFCLLTDLSQLEVMEATCERSIGGIMDLCKARGLGQVVRVIPDPRKDIGLSILTRFHYGHGVRVTTCQTLEQAGKVLLL